MIDPAQQRAAISAIEAKGGHYVHAVMGNAAFSNGDLIQLKLLTGLRMLSLYKSQVTDEGLTHLETLADLHSLALEDTQITDAGLIHLRGLSSLRVLTLSGTQTTDAGIADLKKHLPRCEIGK